MTRCLTYHRNMGAAVLGQREGLPALTCLHCPKHCLPKSQRKRPQTRLQNTSLNTDQMGDSPLLYSRKQSYSPLIINKWDWTKEVLGMNTSLIFLIKKNPQIKRSLFSPSFRPLLS